MSNGTTQHTPADVRERVLTVLTAIEWAAQVDHPDGGWYACCPWCEGGDPDDEETPPGRAGHAELCELAAVIALLRTPRGEEEGPVGAVCANCGAPNAAIAGGELDPDEAVCSSECYDQLKELGCPQEHGGTYRPKPARRSEGGGA